MKKFVVVFFVLSAIGSLAQTHVSNPTPITVHINSGDPRYPFPQFQDYKGGKTLGRQNPIGVTDIEMEKTIREAYQIMMNRANYTGESQDGVKYIEFNSERTLCGGTVSEGDGYAMLAAAYMGDKPTFDGLWAYTHDHRMNMVKQYKDCNHINRPNYKFGKNTIGFCICETFTESDAASYLKNTASDGDWDIALAMLVAYRQWGDKKILTTRCGEVVNYKDEAIKVIKALSDTVFVTDGSQPSDPLNDPSGGFGFASGDIGFDGYPKDGNNTDELTDWVKNNTNPPYNKGYKWRNRTFYISSQIQVNAHFLDYIAPSYYHVFADFLEELEPNLNAWNIHQFRRAEASSDWVMGQLNSKGLYPFGGTYSVNRDGSSVTFGDYNEGEDVRNPWRTIMNYVWHGNPSTKWDPVTHEVVQGSNTYEFDNAIKAAEFLKFKNICAQVGNDPTELKFRGVAIMPYGLPMSGSTSALGTKGDQIGNWHLGTAAGAVVANYQNNPSAENFDMLADWYRQLVMVWDSYAMNASDDFESQRYIKNRPEYFHDWFRVLGLLVTTGNYPSPTQMINDPKANVKIYHSVDKTVAYAPTIVKGIVRTKGDIITHTLSYRNFSSNPAKGVNISFNLPSEVEFVSATPSASVSNGIVSWSLQDIPGYTSTNESGDDWKSFNPKKYGTYGEVQLKVRIKEGVNNKNICSQATISASNSESHTSSEYPNEVTPTFQKNCVDIIERSLVIEKTADKAIATKGDVINFKIDFSNSSKTGWLSGGRPDVRVTYANGFSGDYSAICFYRMLHGAQEPYINPGNYRISYFVNDAARLGIFSASNPNGWDIKTTILEGGDPSKVTFSSEQYTLGEDKFGKWNQRLIVRFADTLMSTTQHTNTYFAKAGENNNVRFVHRGIGDPFRMAVQMEAKGSSSSCGTLPIKSFLKDDWSYSEGLDVTNNDKHLFYPISPTWFDYASTYDTSLNVKVLNVHVDACEPNYNKNFSRLLVEEWDGYVWRRVLGNGPTPGMELKSVCIKDTLPEGLIWNGFTQSEVFGVKATYNPATRVIEWCVPSMLPGAIGSISYSVVATSDCSSDKTIYNRAWISSSSSSPIDSSVKLTITCKQTPPLPPNATTMSKKADKASYGQGDIVKYAVGYKQTQGTIAEPNMASTNSWTSHCGEAMLNFQDTKMPGDNPKLITYDFSHGKNGTLITKIVPKVAQPFSLVFRYSGDGSPKCTSKTYQGLLLSFVNTSCAQLTVNLLQNGTSIGKLTDIAYGAPQDTMAIRVKLEDDKLYFWVNNFNVLPYVFDNITFSQAGYVGYFNSNENATSNESHKLLYWYTNFDSAFEVKLRDRMPSLLEYTSNTLKRVYPNAVPVTYLEKDPTFISDSISWKLVTGKIPMLYGDSVSFEFTASVKECGPGFITNTAYADILGQPRNKIGAQSVSTCGTPPTCTPPTTLIAKAPTVTVCENQSALLGATYTLGTPITAYHYIWRKKGATGNPIKDSLGYRDLTIHKVAPADTGIYILRVQDGTDDVATCYKEVEIHLTLSPQPKAEITTTLLTYCAGASGIDLMATSVASATYQWFKRGVAKGTTNPLVAADSGKYKVIVALGTCADTSDEVTVSLSEQGSVSIVGDTTLCTGETLTLTATPSNVTWTWPDKSQSTINPLVITGSPKGGVYKASLSSGACSGADSVNVIIENPATPPTVSIKADTTDYCEGDTAVFTAVPVNAVAPRFKWFINNLVQTDTTASLTTSKLSPNMVVKVTVTSRGSCSGLQDTSATLLPPVREAVNVTLVQKAVSSKVCIGQEVTFEASGTGFAAGTLYDWYKDGLKDATSATYTLPINTTTKVYATVRSTTTCARPALAYSDTIEVSAMTNVEPLVEIKSDRTEMCSGDKSVVFTISKLEGSDERSSYQWLLNGQPILGETKDTLKTSTLNDGQKVSLLLTTLLDCATKDQDTSNTIALSILPSFDPTITIDTAVGGLGCEGDSVIFTATHTAGTVQWTNLTTGDKTVLKDWPNGYRMTAILTSTEACASSPTVTSNAIVLNGTARQPFTLDWSLSPDEAAGPLCPGEVTLSPTTNATGVTYTWTVGNDVKTGFSYTADATTNLIGSVEASVQGCYVNAVNNRLTFSRDFNYTVSEPVTLSFRDPELGTCKDKPTHVSVISSGNIKEYEWSVQNRKLATTTTDTTTLTGLVDGDILIVVAVPATSCPVDPATLSIQIPVKVSERPLSGFVDKAGTIYICSGQNVELTAIETNTSYVYTWMKDGTAIPNQSTNKLNATIGGNYALIIRNGYCNETSKITIQDNGVSVKAIADPAEFVPGDAVKISAQVNPDKQVTYTWTPVQPSDAKEFTFYPQETMFVKVQVKTIDGGCEASDSVQIRKVDKLFIPNAITPETGDQNASWDIKGTEAFPDLEVRVFNRWGSLVHEQRGYGKPWDGTLNGKPLPTGTYYYVLKHAKLDGPKVGDLTIVR